MVAELLCRAHGTTRRNWRASETDKTSFQLFTLTILPRTLFPRYLCPGIFTPQSAGGISPASPSLCFVFWPDGATDNSLHHRWTVYPVSSCIHVECSASFCPFFHISVAVQKSTQDRTRAAILLNLSLRHCNSTFFCSVFLKSLDLRHVNDDSNTN